MKRLSLLFCAAIIFLCSSCFTDHDNYYVKYEAIITPTFGLPSRIVEATYNVSTEKGNTEITTDSFSWSETFGPVNKGFTASLSAKARVIYISDAPMTLNIYVCRGEEPFVIKAQKTSTLQHDI